MVGDDGRRSLSLVSSSFFIMASVVVSSVLGFVYWLIAARLVDKPSIGVATASVAAVSLTGLVASFGLAPFLLHNLPRSSGGAWDRLFSRVTALVALLGLAAGLVLVPVLLRLSPSFHTVAGGAQGMAVIVPYVMSQMLAVALDAVCLSERRADLLFARAVLFSVLKLAILPLVLVWGASPSLMIVFGWGLSGLVSTSVVFFYLVRRVRPEYRVVVQGTWGSPSDTFREVSTHWLTSLGGQLPQFALPVVVLVRGGPTASATFFVGWSIGSMLFIVSSASAQALLVEGRHGDQPLESLLRTTALVIGRLQVPGVLGLLVIGPMLPAFFGDSYAHSATGLIRLLAIAAVFDGITNVGVSIARIRERLVWAASLNIIMAMVAIGLTYALVPRLGAAAGGLGYLVGNATGSVGVGVGLTRVLHRGKTPRARGDGRSLDVPNPDP